MSGAVIKSDLSVFGEQVFYVYYGRRYWIRSLEWFDCSDFTWPIDVINVSPEIIYSYINGGLASYLDFSDLSRDGLSSIDIREIQASSLVGFGVEFGAGSSPFPVPTGCNVLFADLYTYEMLLKNIYPGQDKYNLIRPDYVCDIKSFENIADCSLDFVIACHVIEHTNDPIAALNSIHRVLRAGGKLLLVVPDMRRTFDSGRELTTIDHLVEDFFSPSPDRDFSHYREFYTLAFKPTSIVTSSEYIDERYKDNSDIHYHVWTYVSFGQFLKWHCGMRGWEIDFAHDVLPGDENIEFYYTLVKRK